MTTRSAHPGVAYLHDYIRAMNGQLAVTDPTIAAEAWLASRAADPEQAAAPVLADAALATIRAAQIAADTFATNPDDALALAVVDLLQTMASPEDVAITLAALGTAT